MVRVRLLLSGVLSVASICLAETPPEVRFPPRPRLTFKPASVPESERAALLKQADAIKAAGLTVPEKEGNWIFYYACPDDGSNLKAESEARHSCPVCKRVFTDERTAAAYRTQLYNRLESQLAVLAKAYAVSGDAAYAVPVKEALLKLAKAWPTLERHDRWGRRGLLAVVGGRRFCQLLDEAVSLINLAGVWDLVVDAPVLSAEDKALIVKQLFRMPADELALFERFAGSRNNHQTWFNAAYTVTGLALGDESLFRRGLEGDAGLLWQLRESVTSDGLWYEGTIAYHFYALQAIIQTLEAARAGGVDLSGNARLKSLWTGPLQMAYPDGRCPVFHDSDPVSLGNYKGLLQWGAEYFSDPSLASGSPAALGGTNLAGIGVAVLRRGAGATAACLMMDYGIHGDSHGHPDKLNIVLYALGRELLLDPGRISYSVPEFKTWCRTTVAHNTLAVGMRDQEPDTGRLAFFAETPAASVAFAISDGAYPGSPIRRFSVLTDTLLIDFCAVSKADPALVDWAIHGRGDLVVPPGLMPREQPLGPTNGYQHLTALSEADSLPARPFTFNLDTGRFWRVWPLDAGSRVVTGTGIGYSTSDKVPFILRRQAVREALFVTVFDLSGSGRVERIERVPVTLKEGGIAADAAAVRIHSRGTCQLVAVDLDEKGERTISAGDQPFRRWTIAESKDCE